MYMYDLFSMKECWVFVYCRQSKTGNGKAYTVKTLELLQPYL